MFRRSQQRGEEVPDGGAVDAIARAALPFEPANAGEPGGYGPLLRLLGDRRVVCLGEASHGTHEFYHERAEITKRLIADHGFDAVVIEGDWPDAYCVNRYVRGAGADRSSVAALAGFRRFPQWMWRNTVLVDFVDWLRLHNARADSRRHAGFARQLKAHVAGDARLVDQ